MLLELLMQRGNQMDFLQLSGHYSARFGLPGPQWLGTAGAPVTPASPTAAMPFIALPPVIDANIVRALESFKGLATQHPVLGLDLSATQSVDLVGAELLLRVIHAFRRASHQLHLRGIDALLPALQRLTIPGERAPTDAAWMLLLEVFRLLQRQHDFEETGIQYCITFEVSPPSWEPPLNNIRIETTAATALGSTTGNDPLNWRGDIVGDGQIHANALLHAGTKHTRVIVECRHLRRFSFSAGPAVLGALMRLQTQGVHVEFRDVNCLVAALWQLLGISPAADVRVRRT
jgi:anti-anti-sigma regulatory factor